MKYTWTSFNGLEIPISLEIPDKSYRGQRTKLQRTIRILIEIQSMQFIWIIVTAGLLAQPKACLRFLKIHGAIVQSFSCIVMGCCVLSGRYPLKQWHVFHHLKS